MKRIYSRNRSNLPSRNNTCHSTCHQTNDTLLKMSCFLLFSLLRASETGSARTKAKFERDWWTKHVEFPSRINEISKMPNTHLALNEKKEAAIAERCLLRKRCIRFLLSALNFGGKMLESSLLKFSHVSSRAPCITAANYGLTWGTRYNW